MNSSECQERNEGPPATDIGPENDNNPSSTSKKSKPYRNINQLRLNQQSTTGTVCLLAPPPPPPPVKNSLSVTQEMIIERIRNASTNLEFREKRWQAVSEPAKQLLRGLLNVDPKKRMKLKDLSRHEWIRSGGVCASTSNSCGSRVGKKNGNHEIVIDLCEATPLVTNGAGSNGNKKLKQTL